MIDTTSPDPETDPSKDGSEESAQAGQDPTSTDHPTGTQQAAENAEKEPPG